MIVIIYRLRDGGGHTRRFLQVFKAGVAHKGTFIKVLARGEIKKAVNVHAHAVSKAAEAAITAAGGTVTIIPLPYAQGRPPVKGNQFTNR